MNISIDLIFTILNKTIDILLVWLIFYYILKLIKDNVKLTLIFKGVLIASPIGKVVISQALQSCAL